MAKKALGKGLGALIKPTPQQESIKDGEAVQHLAISDIQPSPLNPRKEFTQDEIAELADSIRQHGIIQPLIVRKVGSHYELIAGERRWRASQSVKLSTVPSIVREASDRDGIALALIENLQRQDLNPVEEATGYLQLAKEFKLTQEEIAKQVGKSRATVANSMRLLDLCTEVQAALTKGQLSVGHAKVILGTKDHAQQAAIAEQIIRQGLTVRQTEKAIRELNNSTPEQGAPTSTKKDSPSAETTELQKALQNHLSSAVKISDNGKKGKIEIEFRGNDDLQRILETIGLGSL